MKDIPMAMPFSKLLDVLNVPQLPPEEQEKIQGAIRKKITRLPQKIDISSPIPEEIIVQILETYSRPRSGRPEIVVQSATNALQQINVLVNVSNTQAPAVRQVPAFDIKAPNTNNPPPQVQKEEKITITPLGTIAALVFVLADGYSVGLIGQQATGKEAAFFVWGVAGVAIGYAAIRHLAKYKGYNIEGWMFGFFAFQVLIHLSASGIFGEYSTKIGIVTFTLGLGLSTLAIATSFKDVKL